MTDPLVTVHYDRVVAPVLEQGPSPAGDGQSYVSWLVATDVFACVLGIERPRRMPHKGLAYCVARDRRG